MFNYVPDLRVAWLCFIFFFFLSPLLTYTLYRLPTFSWTTVSVFGIFSVITAVTLFVWTPRYGWHMAFQLWGDCFVVFASALPPLFFLDLWQWLNCRKKTNTVKAKIIKVFGCPVLVDPSLPEDEWKIVPSVEEILRN